MGAKVEVVYYSLLIWEQEVKDCAESADPGFRPNTIKLRNFSNNDGVETFSKKNHSDSIITQLGISLDIRADVGTYGTHVGNNES